MIPSPSTTDDNRSHNNGKTIGEGIAASMAGCLFFSQSHRHQNHTTMESRFSTRNNVVEPKKEETDALLAQTLNQLSLEERNQVLHDLHGVVELPEETQEFVKSILKELNDESKLIPNNEKQALKIAESISTTYVHDSAFQLGFLRAELYKAKPAASRMVKYFEKKLQLFGKEALTRPIRLDDLRPEDLEHFRKGFFQLFPERDQTGRLIVCNKAFLVAEIPMETRCRLAWYVYNVAAEDEQVQRKGAIFVTDAIGWKGYYNAGRNPGLIRLIQCLPIRISALHVCYDDPVIHPIIKVMVFLLDRNTQCRLRFHYGSRMECYYALMTFGIPKQVLPIEEDHNETLANVEEFLKQRRAKEEELLVTSPPHSTNTVILEREPDVGEGGSDFIIPTKMDILMGRGKAKGQQVNKGNRRYQKILMDHYHLYESSSDKLLIIQIVLQKVKEGNGRFLRQDMDMRWIEVDDDLARRKIGHAFRNLRAPSATQAAVLSSLSSYNNNNQSTITSSTKADKNTGTAKKTAGGTTKNKNGKTIEASSSSSSSLKRGMEEEFPGLINDLGSMSSTSQRTKKFRF